VPVDFPLAAVSGVLKPRLILSSRMIEECPADELALVLRHEAAHARHRDNLVRAGLIACPDPLALTATAHDLTSHWHRAVEEAADEEAAGSDAAARTALASALVRAGRMSARGRPSWMPALALFDGHPLEARVQRLLTRHQDERADGARLTVRVAGAFAVAAAMWLATGPRLLHACVEWGVRNLP
jgi:Zn-dependent protease with chaperone function